MSDCPWCGAPNTHYMTHVCKGCSCHTTRVRIPGEPHIPAYIESEWNPACEIHREESDV